MKTNLKLKNRKSMKIKMFTNKMFFQISTQAEPNFIAKLNCDRKLFAMPKNRKVVSNFKNSNQTFPFAPPDAQLKTLLLDYHDASCTALVP